MSDFGADSHSFLLNAHAIEPLTVPRRHAVVTTARCEAATNAVSLSHPAGKPHLEVGFVFCARGRLREDSSFLLPCTMSRARDLSHSRTFTAHDIVSSKKR